MKKWMDRAEDYCQFVMVDWNMKTFLVLDGLAHETASVVIRVARGTARVVEWSGTEKLSVH